ncbi:glycoside hydrolase family 36 protein [Victivallis sp. Marseille-Q1083]|uniref:glycoside hydrolase family 36 protein n=1 Tax=Victivallis sp. Marseille-Q1083 TaxID=2717288 RepID=UPI00158D4F6F|nr:glycoside hydrolase family 36 protein [Victivallis sp. Marseille-Q1083]
MNEMWNVIGFPAFRYDGEAFDPARCEVMERLLAETAGYRRWQLCCTLPDRKLMLRLTRTEYRDYPVAEYLPELLGIGDEASGLVEDFQALAFVLPLPRSERWDEYPYREVRVRRNLGSKNAQDDFVAADAVLRDRYPVDRLTMDTDEGRSSAAFLPFFGVDLSPEEGYNFGLGWSGAWRADFHLDTALRITAGQRKTCFRVLPGETIRQMSVAVQHRSGLSAAAGRNQWRRFLLEYHSPRDRAGNLLLPPLPLCAWGGMSNRALQEMVRIREEHLLPYDTFWVDAGWFGPAREVADSEYDGSDWYRTVGDWRINPVPHPDGLKPVADTVHAAGMKFLLWVEIERVMPDAPVAQEHPDWLLHAGDDVGNLLLDLGNPAAWQWAFETVAGLIRSQGVDIYRQDFNFNTIPFWTEADAPDRQGICEAKYIAGLYRLWDALRTEFPDLLIDNCASGGRRLDLETVSRSICLWRSDLLGRPWFDCSECNHTENGYLSGWLPLHAGGVTMNPLDDYALLSGVGTGGSFSGFGALELAPAEWEWLRSRLELVQRVRRYFLADFYLLTPQPENRRNFYAVQCHDPETDSGVVLAFRRPESPEASLKLSCHAVVPAARYRLERWEGDESDVGGETLQQWHLEFPAPRSVQLYFYRRIQA